MNKDYSKLTLKQLKSDFNYLRDNINDYAVDEDQLTNVVYQELTSGEMDIKKFFLWAVKDILAYVELEGQDDDDIEFLENNKRALRIKKRYSADVEYD